jgi:hypothetical protein
MLTKIIYNKIPKNLMLKERAGIKLNFLKIFKFADKKFSLNPGLMI